MIKLEDVEVMGWEHAIRGMRNPMNSWDKSDSLFLDTDGDMYDICGNHAPFYGDDNGNSLQIGPNDHDLMLKLAKNGSVHAKYRRMIAVYVDITAPLYWWKEFDTYKVGTVANSCSTMHKIADKEFTMEDFSTEHLIYNGLTIDCYDDNPSLLMSVLISCLNTQREKYLDAKHSPSLVMQGKDKEYWWQMIQLLPSSYNQKRTVMLNYEVLAGIYKYRREHKLDEWREFCKWIEKLPYSDIITGEGVNDGKG